MIQYVGKDNCIKERGKTMENLSEMQRIIKLTLIRLGIKCDLIGFSYLEQAIAVAIEQPMLIYNLKNLFAVVAKICEVENPFRVEANIQNAITFTFRANGLKEMNELYGMEIFKPNYKPTTAEVIKLVAEYYCLDLHKGIV